MTHVRRLGASSQMAGMQQTLIQIEENAMTTPYEFRKIPLFQIDVAKRRIRGDRLERVETLAKDIAVNGLLQPIIVVELEDGRFVVDDGHLRVLAMRANNADEIDARVTPIAWLTPEDRTLRGLMANLNRDDYTALERCQALYELKQAYEKKYPQTKNGANGGRGSKKNETEIFSFSNAAAEATSFSRRSIELAVSIFNGLSIATCERIRSTWIEKKQSDLKALSEESPEIQQAALDLLLCDPPEAVAVADAITLARGEKPVDAVEKKFSSFTETWSRFEARQKRSFVVTYADELAALLKEQGAL